MTLQGFVVNYNMSLVTFFNLITKMNILLEDTICKVGDRRKLFMSIKRVAKDTLRKIKPFHI
jgi:hypothetical protein